MVVVIEATDDSQAAAAAATPPPPPPVQEAAVATSTAATNTAAATAATTPSQGAVCLPFTGVKCPPLFFVGSAFALAGVVISQRGSPTPVLWVLMLFLGTFQLSAINFAPTERLFRQLLLSASCKRRAPKRRGSSSPMFSVLLFDAFVHSGP